MRWLTVDAVVQCEHVNGLVDLAPSQELVTVEGRAVLVATDPEGRPIVGCPNAGPTVKPCTNTLAVQEGYSTLVAIDGHAACLETVEGLTDGTPPGTVRYQVRTPGQDLVEADA